jgi:hypothetical protein
VCVCVYIYICVCVCVINAISEIIDVWSYVMETLNDRFESTSLMFNVN